MTCMGGYSVCRQAFMKLLGIGAARLVRTRKAFKGTDARKFGFSTNNNQGVMSEFHYIFVSLAKIQSKAKLGNMISQTS